MNLNYELIVCGSPNGNQQWPKDCDNLFCQQFFTLSTDTQNTSDFFMEIRSSNDGHRYCYYSYVHRKKLNGLVNGGKGKREGAYFAMILRLQDVYCKSVRNMFSFMDSAYRKFIVGKIIEETSDGESYLVESLESQTSVFKNIENFFTNSLGVLSLAAIDGQFLKTQSGKIPIMNLYEKSEKDIISQFKKDLKLHLTVDCADKDVAIDSLKKERDNKINEYKKLNNAYMDLGNKCDSLSEKNKELSNANNKLKDELKDSTDKCEKLKRTNDSLNAQLVRLQSLENTMLECAEKIRKSVNADSSHSVSGETYYKKPDNGRKDERKPLSRWLPWATFAVCIVLLIVNLSKNSKGQKQDDKELTKQVETLKQDNAKLTEQVKTLELDRKELTGQLDALKEEHNQDCRQYSDSINELKGSIKEYEMQIQGIRSTIENKVGLPKARKPWDYISIADISKDGVIEKDAAVTMKNGVARVEITDGDGVAKIDGNKIKCIANGSFTIIGYDENDQKIEDSKRTITVKLPDE